MTWHQLGSRPSPALEEDKLPRPAGRVRGRVTTMRRQARGLLSFPFPLAAGRPPKPRPRAPRDEVVSRADRPAAWIASAPMMVVRSRRVAREGWPGRDAVAAVSHSFCVFFLAVGSAVDGRRGGYAGCAPAPVRGYFLQRLRDRK